VRTEISNKEQVKDKLKRDLAIPNPHCTPNLP